MPRVTTSDGRVLEWGGTSVCYCSKCEVLFASVTAFDMHLRRAKGVQSGRGYARHDTSGMPLNEKGWYITRAMPSEAISGKQVTLDDDD